MKQTRKPGDAHRKRRPRPGARGAKPASPRTEPAAASSVGQAPAREPARRPTILVIDDEAVVRNYIREALQGAGYDTVEASHGYEGLEVYRRAPTDMVITDLIMPEAGGQEVILELTWETPATKILAMTGQAGDLNFLSVAHKFGVCRTLVKPFKRAELLQAVREVLEDKRKHPRLDVDIPISFEGEGVEGQGQGQGRVINVSRGGCAVESETIVDAGTYLKAHLQLPERHAPLTFELAAVRWSTGTAFGLEFIRMEPEAQQALRHYIQTLCRAPLVPKTAEA